MIRVLPKVYPENKTVDELSDECRKLMTDAFKDISQAKKAN